MPDDMFLAVLTHVAALIVGWFVEHVRVRFVVLMLEDE